MLFGSDTWTFKYDEINEINTVKRGDEGQRGQQGQSLGICLTLKCAVALLIKVLTVSYMIETSIIFNLYCTI